MSLYAHLSSLEVAGLIALFQTDPDLEYIFRHTLVQDAAYDSLPKSERKDLHRMAGEALEQIFAECPEEMAPRLAEHFWQAGDEKRARHYFLIAGDEAKKIYANPEAEMHYRKAFKTLLQQAEIDESDKGSLYHLCQALGRVLELQGHYEAAVSHYQEMERLAHARDDSELELAALIGLTTIQSTPTRVFNPAQAQENSDRALEISRRIGDPKSEAKINWNLMLLSFFTNRFDESRAYGLKSLALARKHGFSEQVAYTLNDMADFVYFPAGELNNALANLNEALGLWRELGNLPMLTDSLSSAAFVNFIKGDFDQALELTSEAFRISDSISNIWGESYSLGIAGSVMATRGQVSQATDAIYRAIQLGIEAGFVAVEAIGKSTLAVLYAYLGEATKGFKLAQDSVDSAQRGAQFWLAQSLGSLAMQHVIRNEFDMAVETLEQAHASAGNNEIPYYQRFVADAECELFLATGEYERLHDHSLKNRNLREHYGSLAFAPDSSYYEGKALLELGRHNEARLVLQKVLVKAEEMGLLILQCRVLMALNDLETRNGRPDLGKNFLPQAKGIVQLILEHIDDEDLKKTFLSKTEVRKVWESG